MSQPLDDPDTGCNPAPMATGTSSASRAIGADAGRTPRALTEERLTEILDQVAIGVPPQVAAIASGVPRRTWQNWLARGREAEAPEPYASVAVRLDEALATYHRSRVQIVHDGAVKDPRLAQWELERRFSDEWGDKSRAGSVTVNVGVIVESPEWRALAAEMLEALAPFPDALAAVVGRLQPGVVVDGDAVEMLEIEAA